MTKDETKVNQTKHGKIFKLFWLMIILFVAVIGGHYLIRYVVGHILYESTDDAFVDGHIVYISPKISGQITKVLVDDNQRIEKGDLLVAIDPRDYQARVNAYQAALQMAKAEAQKNEANILAANAQAERTEVDLRRHEELKGTGSISKQELDNVRAAAKSAKAGVEVAVKQAAAVDASVVQAQADLEQAELELSYTQIYAPQTGRVAQKHAEEGSFVTTGQPLMAIIPYQVWITSNFRETQLDKIHPGQNVNISVDAFPGRKFKGHVDSIQSGTGAAFSLLPPENATGNYIKVVQRVPVKIILEEPEEKLECLGIGMSVEPEVYVADTKIEHSWWLRVLKYLGGVNSPPDGDRGS